MLYVNDSLLNCRQQESVMAHAHRGWRLLLRRAGIVAATALSLCLATGVIACSHLLAQRTAPAAAQATTARQPAPSAAALHFLPSSKADDFPTGIAAEAGGFEPFDDFYYGSAGLSSSKSLPSYRLYRLLSPAPAAGPAGTPSPSPKPSDLSAPAAATGQGSDFLASSKSPPGLDHLVPAVVGLPAEREALLSTGVELLSERIRRAMLPQLDLPGYHPGTSAPESGTTATSARPQPAAGYLPSSTASGLIGGLPDVVVEHEHSHAVQPRDPPEHAARSDSPQFLSSSTSVQTLDPAMVRGTAQVLWSDEVTPDDQARMQREMAELHERLNAEATQKPAAPPAP